MSVKKMPSQYGMVDSTNADYIGDVETHKILHKKYNDADLYFLCIGETPVCYIQTENKNFFGKDYLCIQNIFTEPEHRNKDLCKKLLFFLRHIEKKSFTFGNVQSELGQEFNKSIARSGRFPMFWLNIKTGEKHDYDYKIDNYNHSPYRSAGDITDWILIAEHSEKEWMPRFIPKTINEGSNWWYKFIEWFPSGLEDL